MNDAPEDSASSKARIDGTRPHPWLHREIGSWIGRVFLARRAPLKNGYCNLGCGAQFEPGYCNADFFPFNGLRRLLGRKQKPLDWALDLRYPLKCDDALFRGVFLEHTLEHLDVWSGRQLLAELYRVIRPGGTLRVSVPSLRKFVDFYEGRPSHSNFDCWDPPAEAIWSLTHNWGHKSVYDAELLGSFFTEAGFVDVREETFRSGRDPMLLLDTKARKWESLYVEGTRP